MQCSPWVKSNSPLLKFTNLNVNSPNFIRIIKEFDRRYDSNYRFCATRDSLIFLEGEATACVECGQLSERSCASRGKTSAEPPAPQFTPAPASRGMVMSRAKVRSAVAFPNRQSPELETVFAAQIKGRGRRDASRTAPAAGGPAGARKASVSNTPLLISSPETIASLKLQPQLESDHAWRAVTAQTNAE
jgi:hypothetical protein